MLPEFLDGEISFLASQRTQKKAPHTEGPGSKEREGLLRTITEVVRLVRELANELDEDRGGNHLP